MLLLSITRRQLIKYLSIAAAALAGRPGYSALPPATVPAGRHMRIIPSTGEKIPAVGFSGGRLENESTTVTLDLGWASLANALSDSVYITSTFTSHCTQITSKRPILPRICPGFA